LRIKIIVLYFQTIFESQVFFLPLFYV